MRGSDSYTEGLFTMRRLDDFVPANHPLRRIRIMVNEALSKMLWDKGIWNALRIWDGWAHDWPCWHQMLRLYVGGAR